LNCPLYRATSLCMEECVVVPGRLPTSPGKGGGILRMVWDIWEWH
jgi:hypothetical protein